MAVILSDEDGIWHLDPFAVPTLFWPYTTIVQDVVLEIPRKMMGDFQERLIKQFNEVGIKAHLDNKTAFGVLDQNEKIWFLGFKDHKFVLGSSAVPDTWLKSIRKET